MGDTSGYQLPLGAYSPRSAPSRRDYLAVLETLDARGFAEVHAVAPVDLPGGGRYSRPESYLGSDEQIYWTKTKAQTSLSAELYTNRLAQRLDIGPTTAVISIDSFISDLGASAYGVGTLHVPHAISSKDLLPEGRFDFDVTTIDADTRTQAAVFQSWIDVIDPQLLISTQDGKVMSYDHGDTFRALLPGPPRMVIAPVPGIGIDWGATAAAALDMVVRIESLSWVEILEDAAGMPSGEKWSALPIQRVYMARWLIKRQPLLRKEVMTWIRAVH